MKPALPVVWLITDRKRVGDLTTAVDRALLGTSGEVGIQLREKDMSGAELNRLAKELRAVTRRHSAPLAINGRFDVALACEADAVHLGGDAPRVDAIASFAGDLLIGVSIHGDELPHPRADYAMLAPVFPTASKAGVVPIGVNRIRQIREQSRVPVYALGGVNESNASACRKAGAAGIAVLGSVLPSSDPGAATARLLTAWKGS